MKKLTQAESDAAVDSVNEAGDRMLAALRRVADETNQPFEVATNHAKDAIRHAVLRIRALTEKETSN